MTLRIRGDVVRTAARDEVIPLKSIYEYDAVTIGSGISKHKVGDKCRMSDGRVYHWALNGAVALTPGLVVQNSVTPIGHRNTTPTLASDVGETKIQIVPVTTAVVANEYANGYLWSNVTPGEGIMYRIKSNPAIVAAVAGYIQLYDPLIVAFSTASRISLARNPWYGTLAVAVTVSGMPVGLAPISVPATTSTIQYYYWAQTWGPAAVLAGGTLVVTTPCLSAGGVAGGAIVKAGHGIPEIGMMYNNLQITDTEYASIFLRISQ